MPREDPPDVEVPGGVYRSLAEFLSEGILIHSEGVLRFANRAAASILGAVDPKDLLGRAALEENDIAARIQRIGHGERVGEPREERLVRLDGQSVEVEVRSMPIVYDGKPAFHVMLRDITERKRAQEELRRSAEDLEAWKKRHDAIVQASGQVLYSWDIERNTISWSGNLKGIGGYEALPTDLSKAMELIHPEDRPRVETAVSRVLASGHRLHTIYRFRCADGSYRFVEDSAYLVKDDRGTPREMIGFIVDVNARQLMEEELRRTRDAAVESDRLKTVFLANISHEIRTPLNAILGLSSLVAEHLEELRDHSQDEYFAGIQRASRRLLHTIHGILDLSRIESKGFPLQIQQINLSALVRDQLKAFEPIAEKKGIRLLCNIEVDAIVAFDEYCLSQIVTNLVDNALKFTVGGEVAVGVLAGPDGHLVLEVKDTGVGIHRSYLPLLFERFSQEETGYSRRFEGSGLGLTLVTKYLEMNGAWITVDSEKGRGSIFRVHFASRPRDAEEHRADRPAKQPAFEKPVVLLVEDDETTQLFMKRLLGSRCSVVIASSAEDCREQLAAHGSRIELILMDLSLQGLEDGLTLTRALRREKRWCDIPIMAVTAHASVEDREESLKAGCNDYVSKPVNREDLVQKMWKLLGPRTRSASRAFGTPPGLVS